MASTASGSQSPPLASTSSLTAEERPQAGPLPAKTPLVGEIGYQAISERPQDLQDVDLGDGPDVGSVEGLNAAEADARNGRHPADRSNVNLNTPSSTSLPIPNASREVRHNASDSTTSLDTTSKHSIFSFHSFKTRNYKGVSFRTLSRLGLLFFILCGLICAWVFAAMRIKTTSSSPTSSGSQNSGGSGTSTIFIHVAFAIIILILVIFFERGIFQFRAERYAHVHPGEVLPSHRHRARNSPRPGMALAPWNRPPLPTYAAALGVRGTGDVEDNIIAAPPPPEYGNTRGSTLLLSSFLRQSRSSNRSHRSAQGEGAWQMVEHPPPDGRMSGVSARSLPISYTEVEHQGDVERARVLEEALAKLEENAERRASLENRS